MMFKTPMILATVGALTLTACVDPNAYPNDPNARTKNGAMLGGILGAAAGIAVSGDDDKLAGALIGGAVGAATGAAIGSDLDRQAAELRGSLNSSISVTNMGSYLVVNMPQDLLFATDSASLSGNLVGDLRSVAASLMKYPKSTIEVIGHTDTVGAAAYHQDLSQRRASAVSEVLRIPASTVEPPPPVVAGLESEYISGVGKLEDRLLILLDLDRLLSRADIEALGQI